MYGDKISMPRTMMDQVFSRKLEIPWQFSIQTLPKKSKGVSVETGDQLENSSCSAGERRSVSCSVLDFRSPENFVFLPDWMMLFLDVRPRDVVLCEYVRLPEAKTLVLRPLSEEFFDIPSHQATLEKELRHYSSLTEGSTIVLNANGADHFIDVLSISTGRNNVEQRVRAASIQDCDVNTQIQRPHKKANSNSLSPTDASTSEAS
eukprot:GHVQ01004618.1.p1 GENE.GHVQ01004618.1~~GHVQ01004618.1.p1  ORF type:complete len:205 (+),score=10.79 GHVQ01004618.1:113-727(+)